MTISEFPTKGTRGGHTTRCLWTSLLCSSRWSASDADDIIRQALQAVLQAFTNADDLRLPLSRGTRRIPANIGLALADRW